MKQIITQTMTQLLAHRRLLVVLIVLLLVSVVTITYIAIVVEASDLRVITHYTAFGATHFYRDSWVYLLSFIAFIVLTAVFSVGICLKLLRQNREPLALLFGWVGVALVVVTAVTYIHLAELL